MEVVNWYMTSQCLLLLRMVLGLSEWGGVIGDEDFVKFATISLIIKFYFENKYS